MDRFKYLLILLATVLVIPSIGYVSALLIQNNFDSSFIQALKENGVEPKPGFSVAATCREGNFASDNADINSLCSDLDQYNQLEKWSLISGLAGISFLLLVWLSGFVSRKNRSLMVALFRPGLKISQLFVSLLVLAHGGILLGSIYVSEVYWIGRVHLALIGLAGIAIGWTSLRVLIGLFSRFGAIETKVMGRSLERNQAPKIWELIDEVSSKAKTKSPDNLIVGMSPSFFVTEANVRNLDGTAKGRTLYLSIPFCRLLDLVELKSIIAHEMGHFVGLDTMFSRHFYPVYRGAAESINTLGAHMSEEGGLHTFAIFPSYILMNFFLNSFAIAENTVGRLRELEADALSGTLFGNESMASALVKVHAYSTVWPYTEGKMKEALGEGKQLINASEFFETIARNLPQEFLTEGLGETHTIHPTDSHPPLKERIKALGSELNQSLLDSATSKPETPASSAFDNLEEIENILTEFEHEALKGTSSLSNALGKGEVSFRLILLRSLILMMLMDNEIKDEELNMMRGIFKQVFGEDIADAELKLEISKASDEMANLFEYLKSTKNVLNQENKELLIKALFLMASADGDFHEDEKNLLINIASIINVGPDELKKLITETSSAA